MLCRSIGGATLMGNAWVTIAHHLPRHDALVRHLTAPRLSAKNIFDGTDDAPPEGRTFQITLFQEFSRAFRWVKGLHRRCNGQSAALHWPRYRVLGGNSDRRLARLHHQITVSLHLHISRATFLREPELVVPDISAIYRRMLTLVSKHPPSMLQPRNFSDA